MSSGGAVVDEWIAKLRALPKEVRAEQFVGIVDEDLRRTASAGTTPDGTPWPERKEGGRALAGAADALTVTAAGNRVLAVVSGPEAIHNYGNKKDPKRQILPTLIPPTLAGKLKREAIKRLRRALGL